MVLLGQCPRSYTLNIQHECIDAEKLIVHEIMTHCTVLAKLCHLELHLILWASGVFLFRFISFSRVNEILTFQLNKITVAAIIVKLWAM